MKQTTAIHILTCIGLISTFRFSSSEFEEETIDPLDSDTLCPRSREDASARGRQCLRKCKTDADCISPRKRCLCDGLCGWSCVRPDLNCDELPAVINGGYKISGDYFGARATYTCDEGFYMSGSKERVCQGDGSWSELPPECRREATCGMPLSVPHAKHSAPIDQTDFAIDSMVHYTCFPGYESKGFVKAKCLFYNGTAQWFGPDLKCIPRSCGHPGDIENGQREGNIFTFTSKVTYACNEGYELVGRANRYCQSNGQWSGVLPSCRPVECQRPESPPNGKVNFSALSFNSIITYECRYGYKLVGSVTRVCGSLKQWKDEEPKCVEIDCESPGVLHNGYLEGRRTTLGSAVHFRCFDGMVFSGVSNQTVCQENGTWSHPLPHCLAPCIVPDVEHGRVNGIAPGHKVTHGQHIDADCKPQYELTFNNTRSMCNNGTWTYVPRCVPARCKKLPDKPKNGLVIAPRTDHGMKALFQCHDGYSLYGSNVTECHFGKWMQSSPLCQEIYCPFPGVLDGGRVLLVGHMGSYDYRPYVRKVSNNRQIVYECHKGHYLKGATGATCVAGQWSPRELPTCVKGSHPNVRWFERRRRQAAPHLTAAIVRPTTNAIRARFKRGSGVISRVPSNRGKLPRKVVWNIMRGRHQGRHLRPKAPCKGLKTNAAMTVSLTKIGEGAETYSHGAVVQVNCAPGYELNIGKNKTVRCARGFWKPKEPECVISPCTVPNIANGVYYLHHIKVQTGNTVIHGEAIHLQCLAGFQSRGSHSMRCWYGNWSSHSTPECIASPCSLPDISNGFYVKGYRAGLTIAHGSSIPYECEAGFVQGTDEASRCVEGRLMPDSPFCVEKQLLTNSVIEGSGMEAITRAEESEEAIDYSEERLRIKKLLEVDEALLNFQDPKREKWCSSPEKLEHVLKYSIPSHVNSDSTTLSLISVAEINDQPFNESSAVNATDKVYNLTQYTTPLSLEPNSTTTLDSRSVENNSNISENAGKTHPPNTELIFRCIPISNSNFKHQRFARKRSWKITCENGDWFGRPLPCEEQPEFSIEELANRSCVYSPEITKGENVLAFYGDELLEEDREFPPSTVIIFRCVDIGKFSLIGSTRRKCSLGDWDGVRPACFGLSQEHDYALEKAPTILFRHQLGPIAQSNDGKLIVYPGIILHLECLWIRKYGNPHWSVSHEAREYQQAWTTEPGRDSNLEYRLSIYHINKDDSGRYTCVTPVKHRHSVDIVVKAVHCPSFEESDGLILSTQANKMNTKVMFSCRDGTRLNGSEESVCLPSGNWSNPRPQCVVTECPDIASASSVIHIFSKLNRTQPSLETNHNLLQIIVHGRRVGSKVTFACPSGYSLEGAHELVCLDTGQWSHSLPNCQVVSCPKPTVPLHGYIHEGETMKSKEYSGGSILQFGCNTGYMMEGNSIIVCQENKRWSGPTPSCVPACTYPGTTSGGLISKVKFYYNVNETVIFDCGKEYDLQGPKVLKCLPNGRWSNAIPICSLKNG